MKKFISEALACAGALSSLREGDSFATSSSTNSEKLPSDEVTKVQTPAAREGPEGSFPCKAGSQPQLHGWWVWMGTFKTCGQEPAQSWGGLCQQRLLSHGEWVCGA